MGESNRAHRDHLQRDGYSVLAHDAEGVMRRDEFRVPDCRSLTALVLDVVRLAEANGDDDASKLSVSSIFVYSAMGTLAIGTTFAHSPVTILVNAAERTHPPTS